MEGTRTSCSCVSDAKRIHWEKPPEVVLCGLRSCWNGLGVLRTGQRRLRPVRVFGLSAERLLVAWGPPVSSSGRATCACISSRVSRLLPFGHVVVGLAFRATPDTPQVYNPVHPYSCSRHGSLSCLCAQPNRLRLSLLSTVWHTLARNRVREVPQLRTQTNACTSTQIKY